MFRRSSPVRKFMFYKMPNIKSLDFSSQKKYILFEIAFLSFIVLTHFFRAHVYVPLQTRFYKNNLVHVFMLTICWLVIEFAIHAWLANSKIFLTTLQSKFLSHNRWQWINANQDENENESDAASCFHGWKGRRYVSLVHVCVLFYILKTTIQQQSINWQIAGQLCWETIVIIRLLDYMFNFAIACVYILLNLTFTTKRRDRDFSSLTNNIFKNVVNDAYLFVIQLLKINCKIIHLFCHLFVWRVEFFFWVHLFMSLRICVI